MCTPQKERGTAASLSLDSGSPAPEVRGTQAELKKLGSQPEFTSLGKYTQRTFGFLSKTQGAEDTGIASPNYSTLHFSAPPTAFSEPAGPTNMCHAGIPFPPTPENILIPITMIIPLPKGVLEMGPEESITINLRTLGKVIIKSILHRDVL